MSMFLLSAAAAAVAVTKALLWTPKNSLDLKASIKYSENWGKWGQRKNYQKILDFKVKNLDFSERMVQSWR